MRNIKTTLLGLIGGVAIIAPQIISVANGNILAVNVEQIVAGLALMGLGVAASDSRKAVKGIKPQPNRKRTK